MINAARNLYYSFPIRLFVLQFRSNLLLFSMWLFLWSLITGNLARKLGAQYLFLDPEYLGQVSFWSFFLLGLAFGCFLMTWNLTVYLSCAHLFPFLASLSRPFTKFTLNNLLFPLLFLIFYLSYLIYFQLGVESVPTATAFFHCLAFILGALTLVLLYFLYFSATNRELSHYESGLRRLSPWAERFLPRRKEINFDQFKRDDQRRRVDTYLTESLQFRLVRSVEHYEARLLKTIFKQTHLNALIIQLVGMIALAGLGALIDFKVFRIPAGASMFILLSVFTAIIGAISYWFHDWKVTIIILFLAGINYLTSFELFSHRNPAYGLDYQAAPAPYSYEHLQEILGPGVVQRDKDSTIAILNRWRNRTIRAGGPRKPKLVILSVSGGGLKSATWAMGVVQKADSLLQGKLLRNTVLITGASGGMMGMAYLRELQLSRLHGEKINLYDRKYLENISRDLLNSIAFTLVSNDIFLPWARFEAGGFIYRKDRGYMFERQFSENTGFEMDKTIGDYLEPERQALIPMLYLTPSIVNDARRMIVSPQGVSFMMIAPVGLERQNAVEIDAVDFRRLFHAQKPDRLLFLSALRMNATYPYVLPSVHLPSTPGIEVMDAGFRDNYGILSATRFIQVFRQWILTHTSGVVLVQISGSDKIEAISSSDRKGVIESLFNPFGIPGQLLTLQEFEQDNSLGFIYDLLGKEHFHLVRFPLSDQNTDKLRASISFHITQRERQEIIRAIQDPETEAGMRQLTEILDP